MSKKNWAVVGLVLMAALAACERPASDPCTPEDLVAPELLRPANNAYIGTDSVRPNTIQPDLVEWTFPADCDPYFFRMLMRVGDELDPGRSGGTWGETTWPLASADLIELGLEPATAYYWSVWAYADVSSPGPWSETQVLFTGPECSTVSATSPPELRHPAPGEVINQNRANLNFIAGGASPCLPEGYFIDLQADSSFNGTTLLGEQNTPETWVESDELPDCTTYFWRVAPIVGGIQGSFSETRAFTIAVDPTCVVPYANQVPDISYADLNLCDSEDLVAPEPVNPPYFSVLAPDATGDTIPIPNEFFEWESIGCIPEMFKIYYSPDRYFRTTSVAYTDGQLMWPRSELLTPQSSFEAATVYYWFVQALEDGVHGPPSATHIFLTGPECGAGDTIAAPVILEPNEGEVISSTSFTLWWEPGQPKCIPPLGYFVDIQTQSDFSGINFLDPLPYASKYTQGIIDGLDDCTTYFVRIAAVLDSAGNLGPFSETRSVFINESGVCMLPMMPQVSALMDLACYQGPNPDFYPIEGYLLTGETATIMAQNLAQDWWYVENPDAPNICAIPKEGTEPIGDIGQIPMWNDPDLGLACNTYTTENACQAAGCVWVPQATSASGGYCTDP